MFLYVHRHYIYIIFNDGGAHNSLLWSHLERVSKRNPSFLWELSLGQVRTRELHLGPLTTHTERASSSFKATSQYLGWASSKSSKPKAPLKQSSGSKWDMVGYKELLQQVRSASFAFKIPITSYLYWPHDCAWPTCAFMDTLNLLATLNKISSP